MNPSAWHVKWANAEHYCLTHCEWSAAARDESCKFLFGPLRKAGEYTFIIVERLQRTPSVNNVFSILFATLDSQKSQYQIVSATGLARQTVAETLAYMLDVKMITITPEPYQGVVDDTKVVSITEHGRRAFMDLTPFMDQLFPNWRGQIRH